MVYQDWARFHLDFALPMDYASFYDEGDPWVLDRLREAQRAIDGAFPILPGLHIPDFYTRPDDLRALIQAILKANPASSAASATATPTPPSSPETGRTPAASRGTKNGNRERSAPAGATGEALSHRHASTCVSCVSSHAVLLVPFVLLVLPRRLAWPGQARPQDVPGVQGELRPAGAWGSAPHPSPCFPLLPFPLRHAIPFVLPRLVLPRRPGGRKRPRGGGAFSEGVGRGLTWRPWRRRGLWP